MKNIILIGFMGSGKTTVGKLLAKKRNISFYDTDKIIETSSGISISDIVQKFGEDYFRTLEHKTLLNIVSDTSFKKSSG